MIKLLQSTWITAPIGAVLFFATIAFTWKPPVEAPKTEPGKAAEEQTTGPSWEFHNPEADQMIAELKEEKRASEKRRAQLDELEARLKAERIELNQATQAVYQLQMNFDKIVTRIADDETVNLKKLAKVYAAMTPDGAANILGQLEDQSIVKIMAFMKEADTANILEVLAKKSPPDSKRAAEISEHLRLLAARKEPAK